MAAHRRGSLVSSPGYNPDLIPVPQFDQAAMDAHREAVIAERDSVFDPSETQARKAAARKALLQHLVTIKEFDAAMVEAEKPRTALQAEISSAGTQLERARSALASFDEAEDRALAEWAITAEGERPARRRTERVALIHAIDDAERDLDRLKKTLQGVAERLAPMHEQRQQHSYRLNHLVVNAADEEAELIGERLHAALNEVADAYAELFGLDEALESIREIKSPSRIAAMRDDIASVVIEGPMIMLRCFSKGRPTAKVSRASISRWTARWHNNIIGLAWCGVTDDEQIADLQGRIDKLAGPAVAGLESPDAKRARILAEIAALDVALDVAEGARSVA